MSTTSGAFSQELYNTIRKWFLVIPPLVFPVTFVFDAPFGRFATDNSIFAIDGIKSWIFMELVSPLMFIYFLHASPLSPPSTALSSPQLILSALYLAHYLNRSLLSPLRTPSRSSSHVSVVLSAIMFNIVNGGLMGTYVSSAAARTWLDLQGGLGSLRFQIGLGMWILGFAGNILHDEILLDIRRKARAKGKGKDENSESPANGKRKEHYAIPQGWLYTYISYPNYFCEWIEWAGFALAAAPLPDIAILTSVLYSADAITTTSLLKAVDSFSRTVEPPYLFLFAEILTMLPRAWKGHLWYRRRFPAYPPSRRAVVPFVI